MPLLVTSSPDDDSRRPEQETVPPLFASLFPEDSRDRLRRSHLEAALEGASELLRQDCFVTALGKFREALTLSGTQEDLKQEANDVVISAAGDLIDRNWRVAEALLREVTPAPDTLWAEIENRKREDAIQLVLDQTGRVDPNEYLPHVWNRMAEMAKTYSPDVRLQSRLDVLAGLLVQRVAEDREKNLQRLALFRDRLDHSENPETLQHFRDLVAPFTAAYAEDADFAAIFSEVSELQAAYENAEALLSESRASESLKVCGQVLEKRPGNILFRRIEEKAKGREWVALLTESATQRARAFELDGQYAEALEEWESLRAIDPHYPGLDSEILNCAALRERAEDLRAPQQTPAVEESVFVAETVEEHIEIEPPSFLIEPRSGNLPLRVKISITQEAWNHLMTGLAATAALLLMVLVLASHSRH